MVSSGEFHLRSAVAELPLHAAQKFLEAAGLELSVPITEAQLTHLAEHVDISSVEFDENNIHAGPLLGRPQFALEDMFTPRSYDERYLTALWRAGQITDAGFTDDILRAPVRTLHARLVTPVAFAARHEPIRVYIAPDTPVFAAFEEDIDYVVAGHDDDYVLKNEVAVLGMVRRAFGDEAVHTLDAEECDRLVQAVMTTPNHLV